MKTGKFIHLMLSVLVMGVFSVTSIFPIAYAAEQNNYYADKYFERKDLPNGGYQEIKHIYLGDMPIADIIYDSTTGETKTVYITPDHLNSASIITDEQGQVEELHDYYPFGDQSYQQQAPDSVVSNLYTGKELDDESHLYYYGARYYDSAVGKFISVDPYNQRLSQLDNQKLQMFLTNPQQLNSYSYTSNNPVNRVDPNGELDAKAYLLNPLIGPTSVNKQLNFWHNVANNFFRPQGYTASAVFLHHSLEWNPGSVHINQTNQNNYGNVVYKVLLSSEYNKFVNDQITLANNEGRSDINMENIKNSSIEFKTGDLAFSLHRAKISNFHAEKMDSGGWNISASISDKYDFNFRGRAEFQNDPETTTGNNMAFMSQQLGVISTYDINIDFKYVYRK